MRNLDSIRQHLPEELEKARERGKYICPLCGSGKGSKRTAAFSIEKDGVHGKCFSCNFYGDIFDLEAQRSGITLQEATRAMIDKYEPGSAGSAPRSYAAEPARKERAQSVEVPREDFSALVQRAQDALPGSSGEKYLQERGFTAETMKRFRLGYDDNHYFGGRGNYPAIVMPYDRAGHYVAWRAITDKQFDKPPSDKAGEEPLFNGSALYIGEPVFVVESQLCAISIVQQGGQAVALGGNGERKLLKLIAEKAPACPLILALDNDDVGRSRQQKLAEELEKMGIPFTQANVAGDQKDPNDLLQVAPDQLRENIASTVRGLDEAQKAAEEEKLTKYQEESSGAALDGFMDEVERSKTSPAISTGFPGLDKLFDGGFYPGLYVVGAITSLGKTTFTLQMVDSIAAAGHDVLFFSLEMAQKELIAKSLSRLTFQLSRARGMEKKLAKTTLGIIAGKRWEKYSDDEMSLIREAFQEYGDTSGKHVWFVEGIGDISVLQIRERVERHINSTGRLPVVVIDYLQILAPIKEHMTDKQSTDLSVLELKRLSRDMGIPVVGISSLNRDNYTAPINNAAFKESGAIEYSSDVLIGLQFSGMDYQEGEADKAREKRIRELVKEQRQRGNEGGAEEIQLKILKFRNGQAGTSLDLLFFPFFNYYEERSPYTVVKDDPDNPWSEAQGKASKPRRAL